MCLKRHGSGWWLAELQQLPVLNVDAEMTSEYYEVCALRIHSPSELPVLLLLGAGATKDSVGPSTCCGWFLLPSLISVRLHPQHLTTLLLFVS